MAFLGIGFTIIGATYAWLPEFVEQASLQRDDGALARLAHLRLRDGELGDLDVPGPARRPAALRRAARTATTRRRSSPCRSRSSSALRSCSSPGTSSRRFAARASGGRRAHERSARRGRSRSASPCSRWPRSAAGRAYRAQASTTPAATSTTTHHAKRSPGSTRPGRRCSRPPAAAACHTLAAAQRDRDGRARTSTTPPERGDRRRQRDERRQGDAVRSRAASRPKQIQDVAVLRLAGGGSGLGAGRGRSGRSTPGSARRRRGCARALRQGFAAASRAPRRDLAPWHPPSLFAAGIAGRAARGRLAARPARRADQLLTAHMAQHLLLGDVAPLLLVVGLRGPLAFFVCAAPMLGALGTFGALAPRARVRAAPVGLARSSGRSSCTAGMCRRPTTPRSPIRSCTTPSTRSSSWSACSSGSRSSIRPPAPRAPASGRSSPSGCSCSRACRSPRC